MFEAKPTKKSVSPAWKVLPLAALGLLIIVGAVVYFIESRPAEFAIPEDVVRKGDPDFNWYIQYVDLETIQVQMAQSLFGKPTVIFNGAIHNNGERFLDVVELKLAFFNLDEPVSETVRYPVRPTRADRTPPVRPFESRPFTIYIEDLPEDWFGESAEMSLHGFRFVKRESPNPTPAAD